MKSMIFTKDESKIHSLIKESSFFRHVFKKAISKKIKTSGYIQIHSFFRQYTKDEYNNVFSTYDFLNFLTEKQDISIKEFLNLLQRIIRENLSNDRLEALTPEHCSVIISWLIFTKRSLSKPIINELSKEFERDNEDYKFVDESYIILVSIRHYIIEHVSDLINFLTKEAITPPHLAL